MFMCAPANGPLGARSQGWVQVHLIVLKKSELLLNLGKYMYKYTFLL